MNRSKLTPCRSVGLSRKKNTPLKTVETLLGENTVNIESKSLEKSETFRDFTPNSRTETNNDTPCRKVGLSRKKRLSISSVTNMRNDSQSSENPTQENRGSHHRIRNSKEAASNKPQNKVKADIDNIPKSSEVNGNCSKKLSNLFPSETPNIEKHRDQSLKSYTSDKNESAKIVPRTDEGKTNDSNDNSVFTNKENEKRLMNPGYTDSSVNITTKKFLDGTDNFDTNAKTPFIKVNYSDMKNFREMKKIGSNSHQKKSKSSRELLDDDDFEIQPKPKKIKKLPRSKTEGSGIEPSNKVKKLKKSFSIGDSPKIQERTTPSSEFLNTCFVKLEKITQLNNQDTIHFLQEQSDDEFELFSQVPKETKSCLSILEKEVSEKKKVLEELQRTKIYKKIHSIEELKKSTNRWKNGCKDALQDLLKQLNMHSYMTMPMLLKKLNIPEDFIPSSQ